MNNIQERFLYHIWDQQHLSGELVSLTGKKIKIAFQGHWNKGKGPDFKNSIVIIDDHPWHGDIEIHVCGYDWIAHNHHEDCNYNHVVLHVVYDNKSGYKNTIREDGELIEILELKNQLSDDIQKLFSEINNDDFEEKEKFCAIFSMQPEWIIPLVVKSGETRLERKLNRFNAELSFCSFDQLFYQGIMESLGYSNNKYPFYQLAQQIPYVKLKNLVEKGASKLDILSLWLHVSSLINTMPTQIDPGFLERLNESFVNRNYQIPDFNIDWNLFRIRPVNHPVFRLIQILNFLYEGIQNNLTNHILKLFSFEKDKISISSFRHRAHSLLSGLAFPEINSKMGASRIDLILINVIIPITLLYSRKMEYLELEEKCLFLLQEFPGVTENTITKSMRKYLTADIYETINKRSLLQQGLQQIFTQYCSHHLCDQCEEMINKWKKEISE